MARKLSPEEAAVMIIRRRLQQMQEAKQPRSEKETGKPGETRPEKPRAKR
ncbi:MAG: hypothetical protein ACREU7_00080 [Burkholderiales bacterium]